MEMEEEMNLNKISRRKKILERGRGGKKLKKKTCTHKKKGEGGEVRTSKGGEGM